MSRCFPFPPPGYEKKPTTEEPDLLKKEKRKEKKHKKDKKDKEKREKDRSEGKHKEKKDKKDKQRDKKDKKGKTGNPDEKRVHSQFEGYSGEKVHPNDSTRSSSSSDKKQSSLQFQNGEHLQKKEESSKEKNSFLDNKKSSIQFCGQNGELVRNKIRATDTSENIKFVQELDRRIRDEEKGTGSHQFVVEGRKNSFNRIEIQKTDGRQSIMDEAGFGRNPTVQNKINGKTLPPPLDNKIEKRVEQKEKMQEKESDDKRGDKRKNKDRDKQRQGKDKDKEKSEQKRAEREKNKHIRKSEPVANPNNNFSARPPESSFHGIGSEGNLKKRKDMETNGVSHEIEPRPNKMGRFSSNISPENGRKLDSVQNPSSSLLDRQGASQGVSQGAPLNSFKMGSKGQRVNGMIDPQPVLVSTKTPPFSAFNHIPAKPSPLKSPPVITNHVAAQPPPPVPTPKPQPPPPVPTPKPPPSIPNHIAARSPPPPLSSTPPPSTTAKQPLSRPKPPPAVVNKAAAAPPPPKKKHEPPTKPPHPDTKYLNQILSVPKLEEWCGLDDQEWLFSRKDSKKTRMEEHEVQVWSEAKHIESVDVCALPYVIPY